MDARRSRGSTTHRRSRACANSLKVSVVQAPASRKAVANSAICPQVASLQRLVGPPRVTQ